MPRWLDYPPVWLAAALAAAYGLDRLIPGLGLAFDGLRWLGNALIALGVLSMAAAVFEFLRARTTIVPRRTPRALLTRGIYRLTRNPIYLGDAAVLAGFILRWDALVALPLVPLFAWIITRRFILAEEDGLRALFGQGFTDWSNTVRRWL